jgi:hypothetical protein
VIEPFVGFGGTARCHWPVRVFRTIGHCGVTSRPTSYCKQQARSRNAEPPEQNVRAVLFTNTVH